MADTQLDRIEARLTRVELKLDNVTNLARAQLSEQFTMAASLDGITAQVTNIETVDQSAIVLIQQLATLVAQLTPTQEAIDALAGRLQASASALAAAVVANTPAGPSAQVGIYARIRPACKSVNQRSGPGIRCRAGSQSTA